MANDFIWKNIPEQLKERLDLTVLWKDIPGQLNKLLSDMSLEKPKCYAEFYPKGHNFIWNAILTQLKQFNEFIDCKEEVDEVIEEPLIETPSEETSSDPQDEPDTELPSDETPSEDSQVTPT